MKRLTYTRSHESEFSLQEPSGEAVVLLAARAASRLGWKVLAIAPAALLAESEHEEIVVWVWGGELRIKSVSTDNRIHDWGRNRKNTDLFKQAFQTERAAGLPDNIYEEFVLLTDDIPLYMDAGLLPYGPAWYPPTRPTPRFLFFTPGFIVTPLLISLNILVFLLMVLAGADIVDPGARTIINWGGNYGPLTLHGQWWRLLTAEFLHIGVIHLLANMLALFFMGSFLEPLLGRFRFFWAYLLTAITASLLSLLVHPDTVSAGASGAIFGLMGIFLAMLTLGVTDKRTTRALLPNFAIYVAYSLFAGLQDHIDNAGHLGGLIGGLIIGYCFYPGLRDNLPVARQYLPVVCFAIGVLAAGWLVFSYLT